MQNVIRLFSFKIKQFFDVKQFQKHFDVKNCVDVEQLFDLDVNTLFDVKHFAVKEWLDGCWRAVQWPSDDRQKAVK